MYKTLNLVKMLIAIGILLSGAAANAKMQDWLLKEKVDEFEQLIIKNHIPNCLNVSSYYDRVYCAQKVYSVMDDLLNIEYKELRMKLTKPQKERLKKVQLSWLRKRDNECAQEESGNIIMNLSCAKSKTIESLYFIHAMNQSPDLIDEIIEDYSSWQ